MAETLVYAAAFETCIYSAAGTYWANATWCVADGLFSDQETFDECIE